MNSSWNLNCFKAEVCFDTLNVFLLFFLRGQFTNQFADFTIGKKINPKCLEHSRTTKEKNTGSHIFPQDSGKLSCFCTLWPAITMDDNTVATTYIVYSNRSTICCRFHNSTYARWCFSCDSVFLYYVFLTMRIVVISAPTCKSNEYCQYKSECVICFVSLSGWSVTVVCNIL